MKVLIADNLIPPVLDLIKETGAEVIYKPEPIESAIADADVLIVRSATKVTPELLSCAKNLKLVIRAGVGLDNIDQAECKKRTIEVANTPGASTNAVAELTLAMMLSAVRNIPYANCSMKEGKWEKKQLAGTEIKGKTLGLIGCGRIGSLVGDKARKLGMKIIGHNPPPRHEFDFIEYVEPLEELLGRADIISLHVPATPETEKMINSQTIAQMKDGAILINTARGTIIDEDALYDACTSGKLRAAALDVYPHEPYTGKLLELDNVFLTPHLGASTKEAQLRIGNEIAKKIRQLSSS